MPKGTFNNKLNPKHSASFRDAEINRLCAILIDLRKELGVVENADFIEAYKYETKLANNGSFMDVIKASLFPDLKTEKPKKKKKV